MENEEPDGSLIKPALIEELSEVVRNVLEALLLQCGRSRLSMLQCGRSRLSMLPRVSPRLRVGG